MAGGDEQTGREKLDFRDANFAANMVRLRTELGLSQADLVQRLREAPREAGRWPEVHQTTISRIEKGERQVRYSESFRIASALGTTPWAMVAPPYLLDAEDKLDKEMARVADAYNAIGRSVRNLVLSRRWLRDAFDKAKSIVERGEDAENDNESLKDRLFHAENYLSLRVDNAVKAGREASRDPRISSDSDFEQFYGADPHGGYAPDTVYQEDIDAPEA